MKFDFSDLVDQKLVTRKDLGNGLYLYKYARKVFYDNLWHLDSRLLEARGIVLDAEGKVVVWPFTKVFNRFENGTDVDRDREVTVVRKVNGFMASVRSIDGELLITTTGSGDSDFVALAKKHIDALSLRWDNFSHDYTYIFEICDASDPHIVEEAEGAYLIGARNMKTGQMMTEMWLHEEAHALGARRPGSTWNVKFSTVTDMAKTADHEGFMVRDAETGETLMKIKSPHYLSKKALMRMGKRAVDQMFDNPEQFRQRLDEEFYGLFERILKSWDKERWSGIDEQARRYWIERYLRNMKKLYLIRGVPGSGKSTFAQTLAHALLCHHVEADFYFERTGVYKWVAEEVPRAHRWCQEKTEHYLKAGEDVVVSNTFTTEKELEWYVDKGREYGYFITVLVAENRHGNQSVHDVPEATMDKMRRRFSIKL